MLHAPFSQCSLQNDPLPVFRTCHSFTPSTPSLAASSSSQKGKLATMYRAPAVGRSAMSEAGLYRHPSAIFFRALTQPDHVATGQNDYVNLHLANYGAEWPTFSGYQKTAGSAPYYCLPLFDVSLDVSIRSAISESFLTQHFHNPSDSSIEESTYSFPLYDGATVNSFRCAIGETRVLVGKVKPKNEAQAVFKKAVAEKQAAALLQEHTPEIFEISLGNLPPRTTVKIEISYVHELKTDLFGEGLSLTIPTSIAPRYGSPPVKSKSGAAHQMEGGLKITVDVEVSAPIRKMESASHPISVEIGHVASTRGVSSLNDLALPQSVAQNDPHHARATLSDRGAALGKDFILTIVAADASLLRSQVFWEPTSLPRGESAMLISLNPRELLSACPDAHLMESEVLLLADRSGSMRDKILRLKKSLSTFLNGLPSTCHFNVLSFGSSFSSMWPQSKSRDDSTLQEALAYLRTSFEADMGGTEILTALRRAVEHRETLEHMTTQVIVLTDGEVWDTEAVVDYVRQVRSNLGDQIRFFALGIGDNVSHRLIEGIGAAGGGFGEVVTATGQDDQGDRISKLLSGVLMPAGWDCTVMLEESLEDTLTSSSPDKHGATNKATSQTSRISRTVSKPTLKHITAPHHNSALHPYVRRSIFSLIDPSVKSPPIALKVRVGTPSSAPVEISIPVTTLKGEASTVHILAAKAAIRDLESGSSWVHSSFTPTAAGISGPAEPSVVAREAERLGVTHGITSQWTSFVATELMSKEETQARTYKAKAVDLALLTRPDTSRSKGTFCSASLAMHYRLQAVDSPDSRGNVPLPGEESSYSSISPGEWKRSPKKNSRRARESSFLNSLPQRSQEPQREAETVSRPAAFIFDELQSSHIALELQWASVHDTERHYATSNSAFPQFEQPRTLWFQGKTREDNLSVVQGVDQPSIYHGGMSWTYCFAESTGFTKDAAGLATTILHNLAEAILAYRARLAEIVSPQSTTAHDMDLSILTAHIDFSSYTNLIDGWRALVLEPIRQMARELWGWGLQLTFIITALDECAASDMALVVQMLWELSECSVPMKIRLRVLVTGIPTVALEHAFSSQVLSPERFLRIAPDEAGRRMARDFILSRSLV